MSEPPLCLCKSIGADQTRFYAGLSVLLLFAAYTYSFFLFFFALFRRYLNVLNKQYYAE